MSNLSEESWLARTELLLGNDSLDKLKNAHILIVGLGGVGGTALEHLCRAGIGRFTLVDGDTVQPSNRNRQILALTQNTNESKAELAQQRALSINPEVELAIVKRFMELADFENLLAENKFDFIVDAIDSLTPKIDLIRTALSKQIPLVSSMGAGGKRNPALVQVTDISKTKNDKLARMLRKRLHRVGVYTGFSAVYSPEDIDASAIVLTDGSGFKKSNVGTISYMPPMFGLMCAYHIIDRILAK